MNPDRTNEKAIVCGNSPGLGFASAMELPMPEAELTLTARNEQKLIEAVKTLKTCKG